MTRRICELQNRIDGGLYSTYWNHVSRYILATSCLLIAKNRIFLTKHKVFWQGCLFCKIYPFCDVTETNKFINECILNFRYKLSFLESPRNFLNLSKQMIVIVNKWMFLSALWYPFFFFILACLGPKIKYTSEIMLLKRIRLWSPNWGNAKRAIKFDFWWYWSSLNSKTTRFKFFT